MSVHERPEVAKAEVNRWFSVVYHNLNLTTEGGVYGTSEQVREQLEALVAMGANHLLLNPVTRYAEQVSPGGGDGVSITLCCPGYTGPGNFHAQAIDRRPGNSMVR